MTEHEKETADRAARQADNIRRASLKRLRERSVNERQTPGEDSNMPEGSAENISGSVENSTAESWTDPLLDLPESRKRKRGSDVHMERYFLYFFVAKISIVYCLS